MYRFYCPELSLTVRPAELLDVPVNLPESEAKHARRVLRIASGEAVTLFDGKGLVASGIMEGGEGIVRIRSAKRSEQLNPILEIATAVPKGERVSDMIEQMSQLGVAKWIPLRTARSIVDPRDTKLERLARTAVESAKQCGRSHVLEIDKTWDFSALVKLENDAKSNVKLLASTGSIAPRELHSVISQAQKITVFIGPEGGWTPEEETLATTQGCLRWSMGPNILRIETAAAAAAAILRYAAI